MNDETERENPMMGPRACANKVEGAGERPRPRFLERAGGWGVSDMMLLKGAVCWLCAQKIIGFEAGLAYVV